MSNTCHQPPPPSLGYGLISNHTLRSKHKNSFKSISVISIAFKIFTEWKVLSSKNTTSINQNWRGRRRRKKKKTGNATSTPLPHSSCVWSSTLGIIIIIESSVMMSIKPSQAFNNVFSLKKKLACLLSFIAKLSDFWSTQPTLDSSNI